MGSNRQRIRLSLAVLVIGACVGLLRNPGAAAQSNRASVRIPAGGHFNTMPSPMAAKKPSFTESITSTLKKGFDGLTAPLQSPPAAPQSANDPTSLKSEAHPSVRLHVEVGHLAEQNGKLDDAERHYQRALDMEPKDLHALLSYARLKDKQRKLDEAFRFYRKAAELYPQSAPTFNYLGLHYDRRGMSDEAAAALARAVQLNPREQLYRNNLAHVLVELDRLPEAFRHLKAVHGEAIAYYNLGYLLHKRGKSEAAAKHLQMAVRKDPSLKQARALLTQVQPAVAPSRSAMQGVVQRREPTGRPTFDTARRPVDARQPVDPGNAYADDGHRAPPWVGRQREQSAAAASPSFERRPPFQSPREARRPTPRPPLQRAPHPPTQPWSPRQPSGAVMPDATGYPRTSPGRYPPLDPNAPPAGGPDYVAPPMHHRSSNEAPTEAAADAPSLVQPAGVVDQPDFANTPVMPVSYVEPARSEPDE